MNQGGSIHLSTIQFTHSDEQLLDLPQAHRKSNLAILGPWLSVILRNLISLIHNTLGDQYSKVRAFPDLENLKVRDFMDLIPILDESALVKDVATRMLKPRNVILLVKTCSGIPALITLEHLRQIHRDSWNTT